MDPLLSGVVIEAIGFSMTYGSLIEGSGNRSNWLLMDLEIFGKEDGH